MPHGLPPKLEFANPDEVSELEWLLLEVERAQTKAEIVAIIKGMAGKRIYFSHRVLTRPAQVEAALRMLHQGDPTPVVRDRLMALFGCSVRHAYTLIEQALHQRGKERQAAMQASQADLFRPTHQPATQPAHSDAIA